MRQSNKCIIYCLNKLHGSVVCLLLIWCSLLVPQKSIAQINEQARYEIDAKRIGVNPEDKDALPRSREFIRLDSTYYVGWMYEGLYKFDRSSDYIGYKQALVPLQKALRLLQKDYEPKIKNIFSSINAFTQNAKRYEDFYALINTLEQCYNNIEMPDSTMAMYSRVESYELQRDFFNIGSIKAWQYHRNRFFTSAKYAFLKNSIKENEEMAFKECYKQIAYIKKNKSINDYWYGANQSDDDLLTTYHYLAILHDYNQNYDSSKYYYQLLIDGGRVLWSNYANMLHETGDFAGAVENYAKRQEVRKFALSEPDYFLPIIFVYGAHTKEAINLAQTKINESGSTPGFGWYNISLARSYLYDGQLDSCELFLNKASNFKELHIGTTLTQSQYDFTINILQLQLIDKKQALIKFCNTGWWYSPSSLFDIVSLKIEKLTLEYAIANAMVNNPERDRLVYVLFCSEATVSYDESMYLLKDFCLSFFIKKYDDYAKYDTRKNLIKYYQLFAAKFVLEDGDEDAALLRAEKILKETDPSNDSNNEGKIDPNYEKLFQYRLYEILAQSSNDDLRISNYENKCFESFPQLMLFSGMTTKINLSFVGLQDDDVVKSVVEDIKDCDIEIVKRRDVPQAEIQFYKKGKTYQVIINVFDAEGNPIVSNGEFLFTQSSGVGKELATRLFGKGGCVKFENPI